MVKNRTPASTSAAMQISLHIQAIVHTATNAKRYFTPFSALLKLDGGAGGWWRWVLVSLDGVAPSRIVGVSASVNLPLHHKVQKFFSGTGSHGWSWKKGRKQLWCGVMVLSFFFFSSPNLSGCRLDVYRTYLYTWCGVTQPGDFD